jgi:hypothetical protein
MVRILKFLKILKQNDILHNWRAIHRGFRSFTIFKFVKCSAKKRQQRLYGMYDVTIVLLFILYSGLENVIDESAKFENLACNLTYVFRLIANIIISRTKV